MNVRLAIGMDARCHTDIMPASRHPLGNLAHDLLHASPMRPITFTAEEKLHRDPLSRSRHQTAQMSADDTRRAPSQAQGRLTGDETMPDSKLSIQDSLCEFRMRLAPPPILRPASAIIAYMASASGWRETLASAP